MRKISRITLTLLIFGLLLGACSNAPASTQDPAQAAATMAAQVEAQVSTRVAQAMAGLQATQKAQPTSAPLIPTAGNIPTVAPLNLPTAELPGVATAVICNPPPWNVGENYLDGTNVVMNMAFNKKWTLMNAGTCTWNANYKIKFLSGDQMSGPTFKPFGVSVLPGGQITIVLPLVAPGGTGLTRGYWGLYDDKDTYFGRVWVEINAVAAAPTAAIAVTSAVTTVNNASPGACPFLFVFTSNVSTNGAGTVQYHWVRSDVANAGAGVLTYSAAGTQTISMNWNLGASGPSWVQLFIDSPNHQGFNQVTVNCP